MKAVVYERSGGQVMGWVSPRVLRYSWRAVGGPESAVLRLDGEGGWGDAAFELARCPLEIWDEDGRCVWWGFISRVEKHAGGAPVYAVDVEALANRVAVAYLDHEFGHASVGLRQTTAWVEDAVSVHAFGRKEALVTLNNANEQTALAERSRVLGERARLVVSGQDGLVIEGLGGASLPEPRLPGAGADDNQAGPGAGGVEGEESRRGGFYLLTCRGWWETLRWRYVQVPVQLALGFEVIGGEDLGLGDGVVRQVAQAFDTAEALRLRRVEVYARKVGLPGDNLRLAIYRNQDDSAPTVLVWSATLPGVLVGQEYGWLGVDLVTPCELEASRSYFLVVGRTGGQDGSAYFQVRLDEAQGYGAGPLLRDAYGPLSDWAPYPADLPFRLFGSELVETTQQVLNMLVQYGQFFRRVVMEESSGINGESFRDGDRRALYEVERLLECGCAVDKPGVTRRLLARVGADRVVRVFRQPDSRSPWRVTVAGVLLDAEGRPVEASRCPVGMWVKPDDAAEGIEPSGLLVGPKPWFVEWAEVWVQHGRLVLGG